MLEFEALPSLIFRHLHRPIDLTGGSVSSINEEPPFEKVPPVSNETILALREEYPYEEELRCGICYGPIKKNHPIITLKQVYPRFPQMGMHHSVVEENWSLSILQGSC